MVGVALMVVVVDTVNYKENSDGQWSRRRMTR